MVLYAYTISDTDPISPKMANADKSIWYHHIHWVAICLKKLQRLDCGHPIDAQTFMGVCHVREYAR